MPLRTPQHRVPILRNPGAPMRASAHRPACSGPADTHGGCTRAEGHQAKRAFGSLARSIRLLALREEAHAAPHDPIKQRVYLKACCLASVGSMRMRLLTSCPPRTRH